MNYKVAIIMITIMYFYLDGGIPFKSTGALYKCGYILNSQYPSL